MTSIKKLSLHESQKIAAGEVIDRPSHCIKELVENSIDARATAITIECIQAGKVSIIVSDNGHGIAYDDLLIAYHRHTTSKINSCDDLQTLTTFGFRGEALASMCAVARVVFITKTAHDAHATELIVENQSIISEKPAARSTGTTVNVHNLFDLVPVRKKFLKKDATEWNHSLAIIKSFIAQHLSIHFLVKHDGELIFNCPPVKLYKDRLSQLYGNYIEHYLQELSMYVHEGIHIEGAITDCRYGRFDKSALYIFVNKRLVKNYHLVKALLKGYENSLQPGKFPAAIISITLDTTVIDVNVHPKKEEVLFQFPNLVDKAIANAIKETLLKKERSQFSPAIISEENATVSVVVAPYDPIIQVPSSPFIEEVSLPPISFVSEKEVSKLSPSFVNVDDANISEQQSYAVSFAQPEYTFVGIYKKTYMMVEDKDGLLIIDQHALHERILYDKWVMASESFETISLLFPVLFTLPEHEYEMLQPYLQLLYQYGLHFEQQGPSLFSVTSIPVFLKNESFENVIKEIVGWIYEDKNIAAENLYIKLTDKLRALIACKSAVKAGDILQEAMITFLLNTFYNADFLTCPHGRPMSWRLSVQDLEKKFKRDYLY